MTREEFIAVLEKRGYSYEIEVDKIIVTYSGSVILDDLETLPSGVQFKNGGYVGLSRLKSISPGVHFKNNGNVWLRNLETIPPGVHFENSGDVKIKGLDWVNNNEVIGIEGVENKRLLHLMISKGLFI